MKRRQVAILFLLCVVLNPWLYGFNSYTYRKQEQIVNPYQVYTYEILGSDIQKLASTYPGIIEYTTIGNTAGGRSIWALRLGKGKNCVLLNASHHASEWLTTNIVMYMIDRYAKAYMNNENIGEYNVKDVLDKTSIWFIPMVNPDGVVLQQLGVKVFPENIQNKLLQLNNGSMDFKRWKADIDGIDPNLQYPAAWDNIASSVLKPLYSDYKGASPLITKEAQEMVEFTYATQPLITVSYHSSGRVIYWNFHNKKENLDRDSKIANNLSHITGYKLVKPVANPSGGGYKDWFIQEFGRPGFTIEIGRFVGSTNLPVGVFTIEWLRNRDVGLFIASEGYKLYMSGKRIEASP